VAHFWKDHPSETSTQELLVISPVSTDFSFNKYDEELFNVSDIQVGISDYGSESVV